MTNIGLNNAGDTLNYIHPDGITLLDSFTYTSSSDDVSYGRETDGGTPWVTFDLPSPGTSNTHLPNIFYPFPPPFRIIFKDPDSLYLGEYMEISDPFSDKLDRPDY